MGSILPIIRISELQRGAKRALSGVKTYAVIQSHRKDIAFVLEPSLGGILLRSGMLEKLLAIAERNDEGKSLPLEDIGKELEQLVGRVLRELSKK